MDHDRQGTPFRPEDDEVLIAAATEPHVLTLTSHRVIVASEHCTALDVPIEGIRRVQLDVEVGQPATLVLVPQEPQHRPQVLAVPHDELESATRAVYILADRLRALA